MTTAVCKLTPGGGLNPNCESHIFTYGLISGYVETMKKSDSNQRRKPGHVNWSMEWSSAIEVKPSAVNEQFAWLSFTIEV